MAEVETLKKCVRCGKVVSDLRDPDTSWQRHINIKYCELCREVKAAEWQTKGNRNRKAKIRNLKAANRQLKASNAKLRNEVSDLELKLLMMKGGEADE